MGFTDMNTGLNDLSSVRVEGAADSHQELGMMGEMLQHAAGDLSSLSANIDGMLDATGADIVHTAEKDTAALFQYADNFEGSVNGLDKKYKGKVDVAETDAAARA